MELEMPDGWRQVGQNSFERTFDNCIKAEFLFWGTEPGGYFKIEGLFSFPTGTGVIESSVGAPWDYQP